MTVQMALKLIERVEVALAKYREELVHNARAKLGDAQSMTNEEVLERIGDHDVREFADRVFAMDVATASVLLDHVAGASTLVD